MKGASLVAQLVKDSLAVQETWVPCLSQEDTLETETATHTSILAWEIPWTEDPGGLQSMGLQESDTTKRLNHHHSGLKQREIWGSTSWVLVRHQGTSREAKTKQQPPWTSEPAGSCRALYPEPASDCVYSSHKRTKLNHI